MFDTWERMWDFYDMIMDYYAKYLDSSIKIVWKSEVNNDGGGVRCQQGMSTNGVGVVFIGVINSDELKLHL